MHSQVKAMLKWICPHTCKDKKLNISVCGIKKQQISSEVAGDRISGSYGGSTEQKNKHKQCQCCFRYSLPPYSEYEICPVCGWIDDPNQNANPDLASGSNLLSLKEARRRWHSLSDGEEKG